MIELEQTADGSYTLFVPELDEHYHSIKGALTESEHIFINMGLKHHPSSTPRVLEIGFGTGLNAFLTMLEADTSQRHIHYTTIERYPVSDDLIHRLKYPEQICPERSDDFYALHTAEWNVDVKITPYFTLHKLMDDFTKYEFQGEYDVIYLMHLHRKSNRRCGARSFLIPCMLDFLQVAFSRPTVPKESYVVYCKLPDLR